MFLGSENTPQVDGGRKTAEETGSVLILKEGTTEKEMQGGEEAEHEEKG